MGSIPITRSSSNSRKFATNHHARGKQAGGQLRVEPWRWFVVLAFATVLFVLAIQHALPLITPAIYLAGSLIAWLLYAIDKAAAMHWRWRTNESTLLVAGLLGGWPGALIAQGLFRHKSTKPAFLVPFWISVVVNCAVLAWVCREKLLGRGGA